MKEPLGIAACLPLDTSKLPKVDVPVPKAGPDDTIMGCELCGQKIWVSPNKRELSEAGCCILACYMCALT